MVPAAVVSLLMVYTTADLNMADSHVAQGERHIVQQEEIVARLRAHGLPTEQAELLLVQFHATLAQHRAHRNLMLRELRGG